MQHGRRCSPTWLCCLTSAGCCSHHTRSPASTGHTVQRLPVSPVSPQAAHAGCCTILCLQLPAEWTVSVSTMAPASCSSLINAYRAGFRSALKLPSLLNSCSTALFSTLRILRVEILRVEKHNQCRPFLLCKAWPAWFWQVCCRPGLSCGGPRCRIPLESPKEGPQTQGGHFIDVFA